MLLRSTGHIDLLILSSGNTKIFRLAVRNIPGIFRISTHNLRGTAISHFSFLHFSSPQWWGKWRLKHYLWCPLHSIATAGLHALSSSKTCRDHQPYSPPSCPQLPSINIIYTYNNMHNAMQAFKVEKESSLSHFGFLTPFWTTLEKIYFIKKVKILLRWGNSTTKFKDFFAFLYRIDHLTHHLSVKMTSDPEP